MAFKIYIDADACPNLIKQTLFKVSERRKIELILVANQFIRTPDSPLISSILVPGGFDVADEKIVEMVQPNDFVITADIPLADFAVEKGAIAISPRGKLFTSQTIKQALAMRNLMTDLRDEGAIGGGPPPFGPKDQQHFANQLDKFVTKQLKLQGRI